MKFADVKPIMHIDFNEENNKKGPKCKVGNHVRKLKYKNTFAKSYASNYSEEFFVMKKSKNTVSWIYFISDLNEEEIVATFYEQKNAKYKWKRA